MIGTPYLATPSRRVEYDAEIAPRTELAVARVLTRDLPAGFAPRRALDLGTGTGAAGRALRARFGPRLEIVGVDRVAGPGVTVVADLAGPTVRPPGLVGRFDLIVAAMLLNELPLDVAARARRLGAWAAGLLEPGGFVIVIEPALRDTSRDLLAVRDRVLASGELAVWAPCLAQFPCPALARERDWCHDAAPRPGAPRADFSHLVLARRPPAAVAPGSFRIVSDPLPDKGRLRIIGCGGEGRLALMRLDRHHSDSNAALDDAGRGDVLQVDGAALEGDMIRIGPETTVRAPA